MNVDIQNVQHTALFWQDDADRWTGEVSTGAPGTMGVYANFNAENNSYTGLMKCQVCPL